MYSFSESITYHILYVVDLVLNIVLNMLWCGASWNDKLHNAAMII